MKVFQNRAQEQGSGDGLSGFDKNRSCPVFDLRRKIAGFDIYIYTKANYQEFRIKQMVFQQNSADFLSAQ